MEYMWDLESFMDENDKYWGRERGGNAVDLATMDSPMVIDTDYWFMGKVQSRAMFLWQGEQVDGSMFVWGPEYDDLGDIYHDVLEMPGAVMAGFRYLTALKSTPRYLRASMHPSLFNKGLYM